MRCLAPIVFAVALAAWAGGPADGADDEEDPTARTIALEPGVLADPSRVPTSAARRIEDALPPGLTWGDHPVRRTDDAIEIATRSEGRFDVRLEPPQWRVLTLGSDRWPKPVVVFHRDGGWWVASAATLVGSDRVTSVEMLDVDGDGAFTGDGDLVRTEDGAFRAQRDVRRLWSGGTVCAAELVAGDVGATLRLVAEPDPEWAEPAELSGWRALNTWRNRFGLGPQRLDRGRVEGCRLHQAYWERNGYSGHAEDRDAEGYTENGARAGRRSSVWGHSDVKRLVDDIAREILHRHSLIAFDREGVGLAQGRAGCLIWGGRLTPSTARDPLLVPARGQRLVPATIDRELPDPERIPNFYAHYRGYPVGVYFPRAEGVVHDVRLTVTKHGSRDPIPGVTFTEAEPYHSSHSEREAVFVSRDPLPHGTWFRARFQAVVESGPIDISWSFSTGNEPFPTGR